MAKRQTRGIRLDDAQETALQEIADRAGVDISQVIRWAIDALIKHVDRNGGRLILPIEFGETYIKVRDLSEPSLRVAEEPPSKPTSKRKHA